MAEQEQPVLEVDRHDPRILDPLMKAPRYKKHGKVKIRIAEADEEVLTDLADGTRETTNTAHRGDGVVTNPDGEQYVLTPKKLGDRYPTTSSLQPGQRTSVRARGQVRAIRNPFGQEVEIQAEWGQPQKGGADARFAVTYAPKTHETSREPYIIAGKSFERTYHAKNLFRRLREKFGR